MSSTATLCPTAHRVRPHIQSGRRSSRTPIDTSAVSSSRNRGASPVDLEAPARRSDEELLGRYRDGRRPEDFAELYRRYSGELGRYLARYLGDPALAEDVTQDTFLKVIARCGLYRDGWPARPWLYAVAIHQAVDTLRRTRRLRTVRIDRPCADDESVEPGSLLEQLASDGPGPFEALQERERQRWVRASVASLPEPLRQVLVLAYDRELSYAGIAGLLGIPLGTVKSRLHGAIARLRAMAERYERAEGR
jgi:RNA polymerase sigma-70 factor (ECF subfamily)